MEMTARRTGSSSGDVQAGGLLDDDLERGSESDFDAYLSADERAQRIERMFRRVSPLIAAMTPTFFAADQAAFDRQEIVIEGVLHKIESMLVMFRAAAEVEDVQTPWHVRLFMWIFSIFTIVRDARTKLLQAHAKCEALQEAGAQYDELIEDYRDQIDHIRNARLYALQTEYLLSDEGYQDLLREVPDLEAYIENSSKYNSEGYENRKRADKVFELDRVRRHMAQLEEAALRRAKGSVGGNESPA